MRIKVVDGIKSESRNIVQCLINVIQIRVHAVQINETEACARYNTATVHSGKC